MHLGTREWVCQGLQWVWTCVKVPCISWQSPEWFSHSQGTIPLRASPSPPQGSDTATGHGCCLSLVLLLSKSTVGCCCHKKLLLSKHTWLHHLLWSLLSYKLSKGLWGSVGNHKDFFSPPCVLPVKREGVCLQLYRIFMETTVMRWN